MLQSLATLMNLLIINNLYDKSLVFEVFTTLVLFACLLYGLGRDEDLNNKYYSIAFTFMFGAVFFRVFLYIQKRVHKEVFFEMK